MPTMQGKPIHSKGSKVVVGRRFMSPTVSQVLAVKGCSWMMSLHCSWGSGDRKKMKETAWECRILLMEEIRLASWYVVYPIIHKVLAPSHSSQYLKDARGTLKPYNRTPKLSKHPSSRSSLWQWQQRFAPWHLKKTIIRNNWDLQPPFAPAKLGKFAPLSFSWASSETPSWNRRSVTSCTEANGGLPPLCGPRQWGKKRNG